MPNLTFDDVPLLISFINNINHTSQTTSTLKYMQAKTNYAENLKDLQCNLLIIRIKQFLFFFLL